MDRDRRPKVYLVTSEIMAEASTKESPAADGQPASGVQTSGTRRYPPLTLQEVVNKLDTIPTFHIVHANGQVFPNTDEDDEVAIRWYLDVDEAEAALGVLQAINPKVPLQLGVTPLGTAFAFSEGWQATPSEHPLKLQASRALTADLAQELEAEPDFSALPMFTADAMQNSRVLPFWTTKAGVASTWVAAERDPAKMPEKLTVVDLRQLVRMAMTGGKNDWSTLLLIASEKATDKAQELQDREERRRREEEEKKKEPLDPLDEPPPLE